MRCLACLLVLLATVQRGGGQTLDCGLVPGWQQQGPVRSYEPDNLFDYMNGNAEGYLIYRFVAMHGITCRQGEDTLVLDLSEMADPEYAYGMFSANRDPRAPIEPIGMGGQVLQRRAIFAKDKYYVEVAANPAKDHSAALRAFLTGIEKTIPGQTSTPQQIQWFPQEGLVPNSVRLVPESVLGLRMLRSGYVGQYDLGKAFLVAESTPESAAAVMAKLKDRVGQPARVDLADDAFRGQDKYLDGLCVFRKGRYIGGFANLKGDRDAVPLAAKLAASVK
ncbi:MAG: hypothetical protein HXY20_14230 [Acidobacteria bacterium]|nr:hypothetical protein [Acidobacteriota bacterium]